MTMDKMAMAMTMATMMATSAGDDGAADMTADASMESSNMEVDDGDTATNRVTPSMGVFAS